MSGRAMQENRKIKSDTLQRDLEKRLLRAEENAKKAAQRWAEKIKEIRALVTPNCTHSEIRSYYWTHDDGYGVQKRMTGIECVLCLARNPWGRTMGTWIKAKDFSYES